MTHVWNYSVERRSLVAKAMLTGGELAEVFGSFGDSFVIQFEDDPPGRFGIDSNIKLRERWSSLGGNCSVR